MTQVEQSAKEPVGSADFREFHGSSIPVTGFIRFCPEPVETGSWIRSPDPCIGFLVFSGRFRLGTVSFLRVFAGNSRNTASEIIVLGMPNPHQHNHVLHQQFVQDSHHHLIAYFVKHDLKESVEVLMGRNLDTLPPTDVTNQLNYTSQTLPTA